jgi:DNA/RNA endonuclease YhcR with UshA esterase domain
VKSLGAARFLGTVLIGLCVLATSASAANLTAQEAKTHIGEKATVCGNVVGVHTATNSKGSPTFINLDERYPHQVFTILIWGEDLNKFNPAPTTWDGKRVCASGTISSYRGVPEIVAKDAAQVNLAK